MARGIDITSTTSRSAGGSNGRNGNQDKRIMPIGKRSQSLFRVRRQICRIYNVR